MEGKLPKYYLLKKEILNKIETGEYQEGSMIESERELTECYQFSRITVRKAIDELVNEGYLYRIQGKGTYVKGETETQNLFSLRSCTEDVKRLGRTPSKKTMKTDKFPGRCKARKASEYSAGRHGSHVRTCDIRGRRTIELHRNLSSGKGFSGAGEV